MKGRTLLEIKELLGHKDIKSTLRYAHLMPERMAPNEEVRAVFEAAREWKLAAQASA